MKQRIAPEMINFTSIFHSNQMKIRDIKENRPPKLLKCSQNLAATQKLAHKSVLAVLAVFRWSCMRAGV